MKCLVTGANGFLGSWLCKRLINDGHEVTALVRKNSDLSELENLKIQYAYGDVTDLNSLREAFKNKNHIYHLAGVVAYKASEREKMNLVNIEGTRNVVQICQELQIDQLLYLSSVVAVGASFQPVVLNEKSDYNISKLNLGYFETKHQAEKIVIAAAIENKIKAVCVNPATIYGPADAKKSSRKMQVKVANGKLPFYTAGGVNVVSVNDVIDGIIYAVQFGKNAERYILGGDNLTIQKLFEVIADCAGVPAPQFKIPTVALHALGFIGDLTGIGISKENAYTASMYHWFDSTKAIREIQFKPSSSVAAIESSVRWMKDNGFLNS
jgi:dihydroflavonol-4-reductase